ncbi:MAG: ShlB/FhaC/HecB family hemolysin secretion/activation protein [Pseudomonadota bacterium]
MTTINRLALCFTLFLLNLPTYTIAADINQIDTNAQEQLRQLERQRLLRQQQELKPDARDVGEQLKNAVPTATDVIPDNEAPCFTINDIELLGDASDKFKFALSTALNDKPILGRCLGTVGINAVMARVQNAIIAKGFVTTRVLAAPQDLKSGVLQLTVITGRVNAIRFTPDSNKRANGWNALPVSAGDIVNLRDIEQGLENFKRVPTAEVDIQIEPATTEINTPGLSDLIVRYQQRFPFRIALNLDDSGSKTTGKYQNGITLSGDNLLMLNDLIYVNYNHDLGDGETGKRGNNGHTAHYSVPYDNWLLSATTSTNDFHQTVAGINQTYVFSGRSQNAEIKVSRLLYRNSINKTFASIKGFLRKSSNFIDDTEIEVQRRRTAGWEFGINQSWYIGQAVLDYNLAYRRGTGAKNALQAPEQSFGEGTSRMKLLLGDLNLSIPFHVKAPWGQQPLQFSASLRGQTNYTPLTPQDRFSIGNRFTVRGFNGEQTLVADHGWLIRNELTVPVAQSGQAIYCGLDYGEVGGQSSDNLVGKYLAGIVIGLRGSAYSSGLKLLSGLSYDVFVAKPINKPKGFDTAETTAGFNLNYTY